MAQVIRGSFAPSVLKIDFSCEESEAAVIGWCMEYHLDPSGERETTPRHVASGVCVRFTAAKVGSVAVPRSSVDRIAAVDYEWGVFGIAKPEGAPGM